MKILYVDESFKKNHYYLVCGVLIDATKHRMFNDEINELFSKLNLPIKEENELKSHDLYQGKGIWENASYDKNMEDFRKIIYFLANSKRLTNESIMLACKKHATQDFEADAQAYLSLLKEIIKRSAYIVDKNSGRTNKHLLVIFDERNDLQKEKKKRVSRTIRETRNWISREYKSSCAVIDCGYSGDSKFSRMLQVADFLAYCIPRTIHPKENRFSDQENINSLKKIYNKCHLHINKKWCKDLNKLKTIV